MKNTSASLIIDNKTSFTMNDVCRLLKGYLREQNIGGALYCLVILQKAQCVEEAQRLIMASFLETGAALNFASVLGEVVALMEPAKMEATFELLRTMAKKICARNNNFYAMVPDMIARIAGVNDENTLFHDENFCYPRILALIQFIRQAFASEHAKDGFYIQAAFALVFNLQNNMIHDYLCVWRVARIQRMLIIGGFGDALFELYAQLPQVYMIWNNDETKQFIRALTMIRPMLTNRDARKAVWDKERLIHVTIAIGLLFGFDVNATLSSETQESARTPIPLPSFFYSTAPVPDHVAQVLYRPSRPVTADIYITLRYGKTAPSWDNLRAELTHLLNARGMIIGSSGRPQCSMTVQSEVLRPRMVAARVILPMGLRMIPAICHHVFFLEPAVNGSAPCRFHSSLINVRLSAVHMALNYPTSMLQPNSEFRRATESTLSAEMLKKGINVLIGGPFCEVEPIGRVVAYRTFWQAVGLTDEPFLMLQRDRTLISIFCQTAWTPAEVDREERLFVWVLEWVLRCILSMDDRYRAHDFVIAPNSSTFLCLAAYYPSQMTMEGLFPPPATYVQQMKSKEGVTVEMMHAVIQAVEETLDGSFAASLERGCTASLAVVYKSVVLQWIPHFKAQIKALREFLQIK